ncbi:RNA-directed DNA polymerase, eukaryota [Tanacetum coccineum]
MFNLLKQPVISCKKAKIRWANRGRRDSKYFHAIINKKCANLSVKGIMVDGDWIVEPDLVKQEFRRHFTDIFQDPDSRRGSLNFSFPNRLNNDQILELESPISNEDIRNSRGGYDFVRWDYLDDVLISFGFGPKWRSWIRGSLSSGKASILVNGSPTSEFHLYRGLKQGDPLAPFLYPEYSSIASPYSLLLTWLDDGHVLLLLSNSTWSSIITEVNSLKVKGVDLISHCKIRVGKGTGTSFWKDLWIGDNLLKLSFPRLFALEEI